VSCFSTTPRIITLGAKAEVSTFTNLPALIPAPNVSKSPGENVIGVVSSEKRV